MIRVKKFSVLFTLALFILLMAVPPLLASETNASETKAPEARVSETNLEIQYLLKTIEESGCTFKRNWSEYPADEARSHMEMKYDYAKDKITETEQFIKYIATKSSITGKDYTIHCNGKDYPSAEWLTNKLEAYRNNTLSSRSRT